MKFTAFFSLAALILFSAFTGVNPVDGVKTVDGHSMRLIAAVELSTMHEGRELHLLAYFPDGMPDAFAEW